MTASKTKYSPRELMAVVLARDLADGWIGMSGANSEIPVAAALLAQRTHAPNLTLLTSSGFVNPQPAELYPSSCEYRFIRGAEAILGFYDVFENSERGLDYMFYSGIQIDKFGNVNLTYVGGTHERPRFRGPGVANVSMGVVCRRIYLYPTSHTTATFIDRVDFVTIPGWLGGPDGRRQAGIETPGPHLVVSPCGVFDFETETRQMRLVSVHEFSSVEEIVENTGFELIIPDDVPTTAPPTEEELTILRQQIDLAGVLRGE